MTKSEAIQRSILLGGSARSGTTIMGKLLGSLEGVEYFFEPAFLHKFIWQLGNMPDSDWKRVFEAYAYDDLLLGAIAGRNLNFNRHDDSCIFNVKAEAEIEKRLAKSHRKLELESLATQHTLAFKIPDLAFKVPHFQHLYPGLRAIAMVRNPADVLNSLISKKWFSDAALHIDSPLPQIDFETMGAYRVPRWVEAFQVDFWMSSTEVERCAYYWIRINEYLLGNQEAYHFVFYDELVRHPETVLDRLCAKMGLERGGKTVEVLASISPRPSRPGNFLNELPDFLRDRIDAICEDYADQLGMKTYDTKTEVSS